MQIIHDHSYISQTGQEFISHGYACESVYSLRFSLVYTETHQCENRVYVDEVGFQSNVWRAFTVTNDRQCSKHM